MRYLTSEPSAAVVSNGRRYPRCTEQRAMLKVTVYKVKCFDVLKGEERTLRCMATRSGARLLGNEFEIVEGSGLEIDPSQLDRDGIVTK